MRTKTDLEKLAKRAGATLEEDEGYRDMHTFQIVAPDGKWWAASFTIHLRVEWARGTSRSAVAFNEDAYNDAASRVAHGLEDIPETELYLYATD